MLSKLSGKKRFFASSPFRLFIIILIIFLVAFFSIFRICVTKKILIVGQENNKTYLTKNITVEDKIEYGWIHSIEHIPWTEKYIVQSDNTLILDEITIAAFGAGIPHDKGKQTKIVDGIIYFEDVGETYPYIEWFNSVTALEYIKLNDELVIEGRDLTHHELLRLKIEERVEICLRLK